MTDQWGAIYELAAMGEDDDFPEWSDEFRTVEGETVEVVYPNLTSYSAKMHRQDPEGWADRAEAKAARVAAEGSGDIGPDIDALDIPAAENIARAFEGRLK